MELRDYWLTIRKRWTLVALCVFLTLGAAALYTWQATPMYSSSAQLFVSTTGSSDDAEAYQGSLFASQRVTSYSELVKTRKLAGQVADELGGEIPADRLQDEVTAEVVPETVNLTITATDADPVVARDIAQAYATALSELVATIEATANGGDAPIRASVVDNAEVSADPVSPNPVRNLGLGLVLGLLLGVGLAVMRELLDTTVSSADDVAQVTAAPILGNIVVDKGAVDVTPHEALIVATPWAESFRVLRTNMQYVEVDHDRRTFVVSSSVPSEGKSTTAVNLAVTLALAGQRVALIECDLRRPLIAKRMGIDGEIGTTSVLIGAVSLTEALQQYQDTSLQVLSCGPIPPNPSELLQSQAMETLLEDLRRRFDVVILDAPPLLPVTDAALLTARSDGMIAIVRHGKTTRDQLAHALERVESVGGKCVGVVMNLVPAKKAAQAYGYGYGYTYGYGPQTDLAVAEKRASDAPAAEQTDEVAAVGGKRQRSRRSRRAKSPY